MLVKVDHKYLPYKIEAKFQKGQLCCVHMDNSTYRVIHIGTGLALCDFHYIADAKIFGDRMNDMCADELEDCSWDGWKENTKCRKSIEKAMLYCVRRLSLVTSKKMEEEARFLNKPEYI